MEILHRVKTRTAISVCTLAVFALFASCCMPWRAHAEQSPVVWTYSEKEYEIHSPQISRDNTQLVFTRRLHAPGGPIEGLYSEEELQAARQRRKNDERFEDPEVILMDMAKKSFTRIDYGWEPVFSPNQDAIAYAYQAKPITDGFFVAAAFEGNTIRRYAVATGSSTTVAEPDKGYLAAPVFTPEGGLLFVLAYAANGDWGGDVGLGMVAPGEQEQKVLYAPTKEHGFYHLLRQFALFGDTVPVLRLRPLKPGPFFVPEADLHELVDAATGTLIYTWGDIPTTEGEPAAFAVCPSGLMIYDDSWRPLEQAVKTDRRNSEAKGNEPLVSDNIKSGSQPFGEKKPGRLSPDCRYEARLVDGQGIRVTSLHDASQRCWNPPQGEIISLAWSPDASLVAVVVSQTEGPWEKFISDELVILRVRDMPVMK